MQFTLTIDCDNAAFFTGDESDSSTELPRLLDTVSGRLKWGETLGTIRDENGNTVGRFELKED